MSLVLPNSRQLREPNLLVPRMKPRGPVKWDGCPMSTCVLFSDNNFSGTSGLVNARVILNKNSYVPVPITFSRSQDNGTGYHPDGVYFDGSGTPATSNSSYITLSPSYNGVRSYLVIVATLNLIVGFQQDTCEFFYHDSYNRIRFLSTTSIGFNIGNRNSTVVIPNCTTMTGRKTFVFLCEQLGSVRNSYVWIDGAEYSLLGTTKDTSGSTTGTDSFLQDARETGGYVLESWFSHYDSSAPIPLETLRSLSQDPYQFLVPA